MRRFSECFRYMAAGDRARRLCDNFTVIRSLNRLSGPPDYESEGPEFESLRARQLHFESIDEEILRLRLRISPAGSRSAAPRSRPQNGSSSNLLGRANSTLKHR